MVLLSRSRATCGSSRLRLELGVPMLRLAGLTNRPAEGSNPLAHARPCALPSDHSPSEYGWQRLPLFSNCGSINFLLTINHTPPDKMALSSNWAGSPKLPSDVRTSTGAEFSVLAFLTTAVFTPPARSQPQSCGRDTRLEPTVLFLVWSQPAPRPVNGKLKLLITPQRYPPAKSYGDWRGEKEGHPGTDDFQHAASFFFKGSRV